MEGKKRLKSQTIMTKQIELATISKVIYGLTSILFAIPSIIYLIKNKTIYSFYQTFTYFFVKTNNEIEPYINTIVYVILFLILFFCYFYILKNYRKVFKNDKSLFVFVIIVGVLFSIIIPTTSFDVYSYIGNGYVDSHYHENPYYTPVGEILEKNGLDEMLGKVARCWRNEPVVYGPVWSIICRVLISISFGNITFALYVFKIATLIIYLACVTLIKKITNKKFFAILFALNPFILFEFLSNVHNDIFLVFFILLAIYFIKNKKNVALAVGSLAIATGIKYLSILLLPFILVYGLKEQKIKDKIKKSIIYILEFILIIAVFYLFYIRDFQVLAGIFVQQNKYGRSIFLVLWYLLNGDPKVLNLIKIITLAIFAISYIAIILKLFFSKNIKDITFRKMVKTYQVFLLIFTFILITNFNPWYVIWLFPSLLWQRAKNIRLTLYLSLGAILSYSITYATRIDDESVGIPYLIIMVGTVVILYLVRNVLRKYKLKNKKVYQK